MIAVQLALVWAGYTITWWGYATIKGKGIGLADLVNPHQVKKVDAQLGGEIAGKFAAAPSAAPSSAPGGIPGADISSIAAQPPQLAPLPSPSPGRPLQIGTPGRRAQ